MLLSGLFLTGWGNDFAHFWGFEEDNYKQTIDWLIKRRIRKVDVGYCVPERTEDSHPRFF